MFDYPLYKAKAKTTTNSEFIKVNTWIEGAINNGRYCEGEVLLRPMSCCSCYVVQEHTICRNTGRKDKNGKYLYQNDFIELSDGLFLLLWDDNNLKFSLIDCNEESCNFEDEIPIEWLNSGNFVIVSNKIDNPTFECDWRETHGGDKK